MSWRGAGLFRRVMLIAFLAGGVAALWLLDLSTERGKAEQDGDRREGSAPPPPPSEAPVAPTLVGRGDARGQAAKDTGRGAARPGEAIGPSGDPAAAQAKASAAAGVVPASNARAAAFNAVAPGAVEDRIVEGAFFPVPVPRSDLVGRVGPYGVREGGASDFNRWLGIAQIKRDGKAPSEAAEDTLSPTTTAVRGVVVREDGRTVPGAEVILYSCFYVRQAYYDHHVREIGRVFTDSGGVFDVRPIGLDTVHFGAGGEVLLTVRCPGYAGIVAQPLGAAIVPGGESDAGRLVLPEKGARIHGTVLDLAGIPVAGAVLKASGAFNPVEYDKTERNLVLDQCPAAVTDEQGRYALSGFASGEHEVSVHIRIDCVLHVRGRWQGDSEWSPRVQAGNSVRGRVVDPGGLPVAAAVVAGGGNWTPTNADGTFWLDNVLPGPLRLEVAHHAWHTVFVPDVPTNGADVTVTMQRLLSRVTLTVVDSVQAPEVLVAIDWTWPPGGGPDLFSPTSRYWHDPRGVFALIVPEGAIGATVSDAKGALHTLSADDLLDGASPSVVLAAPPAVR